MLINAVSVRYAQALFQIAKAANKLDDQLLALIKVESIFREHASLTRAIQSPTVPSSVKKAILKRVLESRVDATTLHLFYVLVDKDREIYLESIVAAYRDLLRQERGQIEITVQSASELTEDLKKQVDTRMQDYTKMKVDLKYEVVPELLGGLVIRLGDRIIDGSVRHQLTQIHERLSKAGAAAVVGG